MTTKTVQSTECRAVLDWLRTAKYQPKGLAALPAEKVEQARERNRKFHERRLGRC
jgi:hypothetical protein